MELTSIFDSARRFVEKAGYGSEIAVVRDRYFDAQTAESFRDQYVYVVLNTGMKNQVAERIFQRFIKSGRDSSTIHHQGKQRAIRRAEEDYTGWFTALKFSEDPLGYLETLPWIGPITKFHLARNLGLDYAKPDRHLQRLADTLGFPDAQSLCKKVAVLTGERVGVVDVILWRACNLGWSPTRS